MTFQRMGRVRTDSSRGWVDFPASFDPPSSAARWAGWSRIRPMFLRRGSSRKPSRCVKAKLTTEAPFGDGRIEAFRIDGGTGRAEPWPISPDRLPTGSPPAVVVEGESLRLLDASGWSASDPTHLVPIQGSGDEGDLIVARDERLFVRREGRFAPVGDPQVRALPDARLVGSPDGRISVYDPSGNLVAAGPFYGEPKRWRHLLAVGPFGPNGEIEIAATRTPHIGGVVEFYSIDVPSEEMEITATRPAYATHRIYTRNLDTARAGDLDGDGRWELLVPDQTYTELGAIRHERGGEVLQVVCSFYPRKRDPVHPPRGRRAKVRVRLQIPCPYQILQAAFESARAAVRTQAVGGGFRVHGAARRVVP